MTALKGRDIEAFLKRRPADIAAVLAYGPDAGLVRERADRLASAVVADFKDPFNYIEFSDSDLKGEPGRLADEAQALSFTGGERVIRVKGAGDAATKALETLIAGLDKGHLKSNALVVVEAGDLAKSSALRKLFEKARAGAALPCYADGPGDVRALALQMATAEELTFERDALDLVVALLGDDRGVTRSELEKLILYKGPKSIRSGLGTITVDDARECLVDGVGDALDEAAGAAADGAPATLSRALWKSAAAGASPIGLLRALSRAFSRLHAAQAMIAAGVATNMAMKRLRPPVFFMEERAFEARLRKWPLKELEAALDLLVEAELSAKTTGAPQKEIAERAALSLALRAGR